MNKLRRLLLPLSDPIDYEALVRGAWNRVNIEDHTECCGDDASEDKNVIRIALTGIGWFSWNPTHKSAWAAAWAFTEARLEEIRQRKAEIDELEDVVSIRQCMNHADHIQTRCRLNRAIDRLQAALAELQKDMKQD